MKNQVRSEDPAPYKAEIFTPEDDDYVIANALEILESRLRNHGAAMASHKPPKPSAPFAEAGII